MSVGSANSATLIHSARLVTGGQEIDDGWVLFAGDTIAATGARNPPPASKGTDVIDAAGRILAPGFIDIHCHGGAGGAFDDGPDAIASALAMHRSHGTTRSVLSLVTADLDSLAERLSVVADIAEADPLVLGAHLEGPFLADAHRGAHDRRLLRAPDVASIEALLQAGRGRICQVTLAPELSGGMAALARFIDAGVAVAVGHTDADFAEAAAAFDAGASILTHAFNGMFGVHHRQPGPVVAAMRANGVTLEIIADGTHLHDEVIRLAFAGAPSRIALITDAMAAAGSADGSYQLGSLTVTVADGIARLATGDGTPGSIAGSTLTLDAALRRAVTGARIPIAEAVQALTGTPAYAVGRGHDLGALSAGYAADAVLLERDLSVAAVWAGGIRQPS